MYFIYDYLHMIYTYDIYNLTQVSVVTSLATSFLKATPRIFRSPSPRPRSRRKRRGAVAAGAGHWPCCSEWC